MNARQPLENLTRLAQLRQLEVDRHLVDVTSKEGLRERYQRNLDRLEALFQRSSGNYRSPSLALNQANYKQIVMQLSSLHREELALHEADIAASRRALAEISRQHEAIQQLLTRERQNIKRTETVQEQKLQDDMASKVWLRRRA
jgi:flagellar biosynthesis chaperone FliJ